MDRDFHQVVREYTEAAQRFVTATVIRVLGSASAKPGSKAVIDAQGRNVFGWVGGGCAESLVRHEALQALEERRSRIVEVDLDDEVLGVGMPCGGHMEVYIEPHFPAPSLLIAGHNRLARQIAHLGAMAGYAVSVNAPKATKADFPTAARVAGAPWEEMTVPPDARVVIATDHEGHVPALESALGADPAHLALVASRTLSPGIFKRLGAKGVSVAQQARIRTPAGLHLGGNTIEEISLSILGELLMTERAASALPLRMVKMGHAGIPPAKAKTQPEEGDGPELLIVGQGRIAEELARLGVMLRWRVTVNADSGAEEFGTTDFPGQVRLITGDLDFSRMEVNPSSYVVVATLHKGDHLSMERALAGNAPYIGLIASQRRSGLVLDYLRERGVVTGGLETVFAPAGLELGSRTPFEIALSVMSEIVAVHRGGSGRPLCEVEAASSPHKPDACRELFE